MTGLAESGNATAATIETTVAMSVRRAIAVPAQANVREFCAVDLASSWVSSKLASTARNSSFCCSRVS